MVNPARKDGRPRAEPERSAAGQQEEVVRCG